MEADGAGEQDDVAAQRRRGRGQEHERAPRGAPVDPVGQGDRRHHRREGVWQRPREVKGQVELHRGEQGQEDGGPPPEGALDRAAEPGERGDGEQGQRAPRKDADGEPGERPQAKEQGDGQRGRGRDRRGRQEGPGDDPGEHRVVEVPEVSRSQEEQIVHRLHAEGFLDFCEGRRGEVGERDESEEEGPSCFFIIFLSSVGGRGFAM